MHLSTLKVYPTHQLCMYSATLSIILQLPLLELLFVALDLIADLEILPAIERDTALSILTHLLDIFLHVLE